MFIVVTYVFILASALPVLVVAYINSRSMRLVIAVYASVFLKKVGFDTAALGVYMVFPDNVTSVSAWL